MVVEIIIDLLSNMMEIGDLDVAAVAAVEI